MERLGIWMWPDHVEARGAERVMDRCREAGVTDVFFLAKGLRGATAFPCPDTPPACPGRDLMREALEAAHARGMRVHAWFTSAGDAAYKEAHPQSGLCHFTRGRDRGIVSITDAGYRHFMRGVVEKLLREYEVDGLHLDYIRYNHLTYGWSESDEAAYEASGVSLPHARRLMERTFFAEEAEAECIFDAYRAGDESVLALALARRRNVTDFARGLIEAARAMRPGLCVSAALMPEGAYEDLAFSDLHYGQNYQDAAALFDLALPMAYSGAYGQGPEWVARVARGTVARGLPAMIGLHAYEGGTGPRLAADREAVAALEGLQGLQGVCLFREGATALAYPEGGALRVYNALRQPLTRIAARGEGREYIWEGDLPPEGETRLHPPFAVDEAAVFTPDGEACVYLRKH